MKAGFHLDQHALAFISAFWLIIIIFLVIHALVCMAIADWAQRKGREYFAFFLISFFFSELIAIIILASIAPPSTTAIQTRGKTRKCPYCAEEILAEAKKCRHCLSDIAPDSAIRS